MRFLTHVCWRCWIHQKHPNTGAILPQFRSFCCRNSWTPALGVSAWMRFENHTVVDMLSSRSAGWQNPAVSCWPARGQLDLQPTKRTEFPEFSRRDVAKMNVVYLTWLDRYCIINQNSFEYIEMHMMYIHIYIYIYKKTTFYIESANEDATSTWRCDISQVVVYIYIYISKCNIRCKIDSKQQIIDV